MRFIAGMAAIGTLALGACGEDAGEPKTPEEVMREARNLVTPEPGLYTSRAELLEFDVPGLPPDQADRLKQIGSGLTSNEHSYCLTQDEAEKGFEDAVRKMGEGTGDMTCTFSKFDANGSTLDAVLNCTGPQGTEATMNMSGMMERDRSEMEMEMSHKAGPIPGGTMKMRMKVISQRTGDCPG